MNGILILDKPQGFTSFDAVAVLRGLAREKKIGHTGTLDPMATGVLPVLLGRAAKALNFLPDTDKEYTAAFRLGERRDTGDITGQVVEESAAPVFQEALEAALPAFRGEILQVPPMYSAVSVGGKRLYELARKGLEVERQARPVTVSALELLSYDAQSREGRLRVACSKGTYIRVLIEDIAKAAGSCGTMTALRRVRACGFGEGDARSLEELKALAAEGRLAAGGAALWGVPRGVGQPRPGPALPKRRCIGFGAAAARAPRGPVPGEGPPGAVPGAGPRGAGGRPAAVCKILFGTGGNAMRIIHQVGELLAQQRPAPCSLALGAFDGLHRGHMAVIHAACAPGAGGQALEPAVFTFCASPSGNSAVLTGRDKERLLEDAGISTLYSLDFAQVRDWQAEDFVRQVLFAACNARRLCCGEDFRFGKGAAGDVALLRSLCQEAGVELYVVPPVEDGGEKVSSTRIRKAVEAGDIPTANRLLGRPFGFSLEVIHGNHIGTGLGTPTINQAIPEGFVLPRFGVYASWCRVGGQFFYGVTNVGVKPTVGSDKVLAETWMPEFSGDLYGKRVRVFLLEFLRPERKFASLEELKAAITYNGRQAQAVAARTPPPAFPASRG